MRGPREVRQSRRSPAEEVDPLLPVASQGKGLPARHKRPPEVRDAKHKALFDNLCCVRICAMEMTPPHTLQSSSQPLPMELEMTVVASHARRTCSQKPFKETGKRAISFRFDCVSVFAIAPASFSHFFPLCPEFDTKVERFSQI
jgi:hypothetical protein